MGEGRDRDYRFMSRGKSRNSHLLGCLKRRKRRKGDLVRWGKEIFSILRGSPLLLCSPLPSRQAVVANPLISEKVNLEEERRRKNKLGHLFPPLSKFAGRAGWGKSLPRSGKFFRWSKRWHEKGKRRGESWLGRGGGGAQRKRGEPSSSTSSSFMPGRIFGGRTSLDVSPLLALSPTSKQGITRGTEGGEKSTIQSV